MSRAGRGVDEGQELMRCSWTGGLEICYVTSSLGKKREVRTGPREEMRR